MTCMTCGRAIPFMTTDENECAGWRLQLKPKCGWLCPGCAEPHEDEIRLSELNMTIDALSGKGEA